MFVFQENKNFLFESNGIEQGYVSILNDDFETALSVFNSYDSPRAKWASVLIEILSGYLEHHPSYFEIRNFLEIDLDFLLKNKKINYVESLLGAAEILVRINQETYKYIARVMFENKLFNAAKDYLEKSKNILYNDPEMHFLFCKLYINSRDYPNALHHITECLTILPDYYPAKKLKSELERYINTDC